MKKKCKKTSCKVLKKYAHEEHETSEDYRRRGFKSQARDERRHSRYFKKMAKKKCKK